DAAGESMLERDTGVAPRSDCQFDAYRAVAHFVRDARDRSVDRAVLCPGEPVQANAGALAAPDATRGYRGREQSDGDDVSIGNDERQALTRLDDGSGPQRGDVAESARGSGPDGVPVGLDPQTEERVLRSALFAFEPRDLAADLIERCRAIAIAGDLFLLDTDKR